MLISVMCQATKNPAAKIQHKKKRTSPNVLQRDLPQLCTSSNLNTHRKTSIDVPCTVAMEWIDILLRYDDCMVDSSGIKQCCIVKFIVVEVKLRQMEINA